MTYDTRKSKARVVKCTVYRGNHAHEWPVHGLQITAGSTDRYTRLANAARCYSPWLDTSNASAASAPKAENAFSVVLQRSRRCEPISPYDANDAYDASSSLKPSIVGSSP